MTVIADLVAIIDVQDGQPAPKVKNLRVFRLKHADSKNIMGVLATLEIANISGPCLAAELDRNNLIVLGDAAGIRQIEQVIQALDVEGHPIGDARPFTDGRDILFSHFVPRPGQNEMVGAWQDRRGGDMHVEFWDGSGEVMRSWAGPVPQDFGLDLSTFGSPHVVVDGGRVFVLWHGQSEPPEPNAVYLREFGCVP